MSENIKFKSGSLEATELIENIQMFGINYLAQNFRLLGIVQEPADENTVMYQFEDGLQIMHSGYSASSQDVLFTQIFNANGEQLLCW